MKSKKRLSMEHNGKTILDYFKVINRSSSNNDSQYSPDVKQQTNQMKSSNDKKKKRPATYFDGCITIDDDDDDNTKISTEDNDIQEIQRKRYIYGVFLVVESLLSRLVTVSDLKTELISTYLVLLKEPGVVTLWRVRYKCSF